MGKVWNVPNALSMFRVLLIIPLGIALWEQENVIAVLIGILTSITDNLDGYYARRLNQITEFGKIIDPVSDKLLVGVIVIILLIQERMPLWFALVIWGRDVLLMLGSLWAAKKIGLVLPSNVLGKMTITVLGLTLMFIMLNIKVVAFWGIWASTALLAGSFIYYFTRMVLIIKKQNKQT